MIIPSFLICNRSITFHKDACRFLLEKPLKDNTKNENDSLKTLDLKVSYSEYGDRVQTVRYLAYEL